LALAVVVDEVPPPGAAVIGWPILWAIPLAPLRVAGGLDPDTAFAVALPLQLLANAVAVVACGYAGWYATGRRWAGIGAAALFTAWPLVTRALAGPDAWANGQWHVDVGLHLYTEPISTALVVVALALLLSPRLDAVRLTLAGVLLGFGTAVRVSNGLLAAAVVVLVVGRLGVRRAAPLLVGGAAFVPLVLVYWPKGYPEIPNVPTFSPGHAARNWSESLVFTPWVTVALVVLAVAGAFAVRDRWHALLLGAAVAVNPAFYTFYEVTYLHPRFLYASLPPLFVLVAAAVVGVRPRKSEASVDV
ncbi:MAG TPA: hypothetical protein VEY87_13855, partial [Gaiellaceae bacterium]|nr:hypothetical protein [Gaiellaceae bacterium]